MEMETSCEIFLLQLKSNYIPYLPHQTLLQFRSIKGEKGMRVFLGYDGSFLDSLEGM